MAFIDTSYFRADIYLAQNKFTTTEIGTVIDNVERDTLISALGYDLYKAFIAGLAEVSPAAKWTNLRDGAEYTVTDQEGRTVTVKWQGLKNTQKISLLAYFSFFEYIKQTYSVNSTPGEVIPLGENSIPSQREMYYKLINAWNKGVELYGNDNDYYKETTKPSLYNFLYWANTVDDATYPNWNFKNIDTINIFGI